MAAVRVRPSEPGQRALWRPRRRRGAGREPLAAAELRRRGAEYGELGTGSLLVPSLHRFFEQRATGVGA
jgi:hypothetical protein